MSEQTPFMTLGKHLQYVREQSQQSLAEVSGAVEIDQPTLERIEAGRERPAEDILLLLISHFNVQDLEAVQLWELANYEGDIPEQLRPDVELPHGGKIVMLMTLDMRTLYSDGLEILLNPSGMTLNFTQAGGKPGASTPVARVGMSYDQAETIFAQLGKALLTAKYSRGPRRLAPGDQPPAQ